MKGEVVKYGQSLYDFVVEKYGSVRFLSKFVRDNGIGYEGLVTQGQTLLIDTAEGNTSNKYKIRNKGIVINNNINNTLVTQLALFEDELGILYEDGEQMIYENVI